MSGFKDLFPDIMDRRDIYDFRLRVSCECRAFSDETLTAYRMIWSILTLIGKAPRWALKRFMAVGEA